VTALLDAIARVFVVSPAQARSEPVAAAVPSAAVCGPQAEAVAAALALRLRSRGPVVVCAWASSARRASAPATASARRLAASMHARGLDAAATGRLVLVRLDDDPRTAVAGAERAAAAAGAAPIVTAICGPRDPAFDALLEAQDCAIVVARDVPDEVRRLAVAALGPRAVAVSPLAAVSDWAARAGVWASPAVRRALADVQAVLR
jgi:stage V sporulation protein SpoVS